MMLSPRHHPVLTRSLHQLLFKLLAVVALTLCFSSTSAADDITVDVFGSYTRFMPAAFGDFNSDKHTDFIVIEHDKLSTEECVVKVMLSHQDPPLLRPVGPNCTCPGGNVKSVVPGDYDGDGALDLLMLSVRTDGLYDVYVAWGNLENLTCPSESLLTVRGQPLVMDYNGDMIADLFGESENKTRSFWLFGTTQEPPRQVPMLHAPFAPLPALRIPSSHGFVDLNGDLAADLFVTAEGQFEIWINTDHGFILTETIPIPEWAQVVGQTTFTDIALQGQIEPITVMCKSKDCSDGQVYVWSVNKMTGKKMFMSLGFPLADGDKTYSFPSNGHHTYPYTDTISLRVADHDLDGYPDVLFTLLDASDNPQVFLAINEACTEPSCEHSRRLQPSWNLLSAFPGSVLGTFFDVFEDGRMDILLLHQDPNDKGRFLAAAVTDTKQYDAMFLKVLVPSGRCYSDCKHHHLPYGTNPAGPTFRYTIISDGDSMQSSAATQLSQSAHMALQLPYTLFGLGRNWNFVETLSVGLPIKDTITHSGFYRNDSARASFLQDDQQSTIVNDDGGRAITESVIPPGEFPTVRNFTQIIPNSQVIVIPYQLNQPLHWVNKLYITPSKALKLTAAALLVVCLLVAIVIGVLHFREKREDRKEKLQQAQTFHFDAM